ncbi:MAG: DUF4352 domain-containing protein [Streptomycetaceae bacterium]|nr:DUF4352 domain-containing protein [Streptomycetaceae bacterium]
MEFVRWGAVVVVSAVLGTVLLSGCNGDDDKVNTQAKTPDAASLDCDNPNIPMGEWKKRCEKGASPGNTKEPQETGKSGGSPSGSGKSSDKPQQNPAAKTGDTIAMQGDDGEKFDAVLVQLVDPGTPKDEYSGPDPGNRLVAIQWRITNTGATVVDETPTLRTKLVDAQGQIYEFAIGADHKGTEFPTSAQIPPGESRLGFVTYEVPKAAKIVKVEFEGGYDKPSGQWTVG